MLAAKYTKETRLRVHDNDSVNSVLEITVEIVEWLGTETLGAPLLFIIYKVVG